MSAHVWRTFYTPAQLHDDLTPLLARNCWLVAARGLVAVLFGVVALLSPVTTIAALILVYAAYMLADGVLATFAALRAAGRHDRWGLLLLEGIIDLLAGGIAIAFPDLTLLTFAVLLGAWALVSGAVLAAAGLQLPSRTGRWLMVLSGLASTIWGGLLLIFPATGMITLVWWIGAYAVTFGLLLLVLGVQLWASRIS